MAVATLLPTEAVNRWPQSLISAKVPTCGEAISPMPARFSKTEPQPRRMSRAAGQRAIRAVGPGGSGAKRRVRRIMASAGAGRQTPRSSSRISVGGYHECR